MRHPDAPAWLPDTFCLTCNKMAETISYVDYSQPGHMWVRVFKARCHGAVADRTGPTAFPPRYFVRTAAIAKRATDKRLAAREKD
jgi:hypothetical protein